MNMKHRIYLTERMKVDLVGLIHSAFWIQKSKYFMDQQGNYGVDIRNHRTEDLILRPQWADFCERLGIKDEIYKSFKR